MSADLKVRPPGRAVSTASPRRRSRVAPPWWFTLPALLLFAFVVLVPSARGVYYAFTDWDGLDPDFALIGLRNFTDMLDDARRAAGGLAHAAHRRCHHRHPERHRAAAGPRRQQHDQDAQRAAGAAVRPRGGHPDRHRLPVAQPARPGRRGQQPARRGRPRHLATGLARRPGPGAVDGRAGRGLAVRRLLDGHLPGRPAVDTRGDLRGRRHRRHRRRYAASGRSSGRCSPRRSRST